MRWDRLWGSLHIHYGWLGSGRTFFLRDEILRHSLTCIGEGFVCFLFWRRLWDFFLFLFFVLVFVVDRRAFRD